MVKHRRERQPETKSLGFPSKNVCHSNLEPAAQLYGQTEQVYSYNCTYSFLSIGHKIAAHAAGECAHGKEKLEGTLVHESQKVENYCLTYFGQHSMTLLQLIPGICSVRLSDTWQVLKSI